MAFIPVWWIWIGYIIYNERFETFGFENQLLTFLMMVSLAGMAFFSSQAIHESFVGFTFSYATARIIFGGIYLRTGYILRDFRHVGSIVGTSFLASALIIITTALLIPHPLRIYLFGAILLFDVLVPFIPALTQGTFKNSESRGPSDRMNERLGLFSKIVLGGLVVSVIIGISSLGYLSAHDLFHSFLGLSVGFGLWWLYFDFVARRGAHQFTTKLYLWSYLHMPLTMSFVALGAGLLYSIKYPDHLPESARLLVALSAGIAIITIGFLETVSHRDTDEPMGAFSSPLSKIISGIVIIGIGVFSHGEMGSILLIIFSILALHMIYGMWRWFHLSVDSEHETDNRG